MAKLLLIESPGKIKKLSQILGPDWIVKASMGHIRELANDGEDALGFELQENRVICRYEPRGERAKNILKELRFALKQASEVYIATDPDREGETIGWHLAQELKLKQPKRVTYTEITPAAVRAAIASPRPLNQNLIAAGRARDCLDKLVGYKGSKHLVWALNNGAKSMGRVQSATLHLLCLREKEILAFTPQDYWSVWVEYTAGFKAFYRAGINQIEENLTTDNPKDDAAESSAKLKPESEKVTSQIEADRLVEIAKNYPHQVVKVEGKTTSQSPPPPFTTSTLQQAAGAKLRFSPETTMKVAQSLYEAGHITYMRTDSVALSEQFCASVRQYLQHYDPHNVPRSVTKYRSSQNAQEAHEAIRPTEVYQTPPKLSVCLSSDEAKLYDLIWRRAVASQCCAATVAKTRILTQSGSVFWEARGQVLTFPAYTVYWNNISDDSQLPALQQGQFLPLKSAGAEKKQTQPPPRYTEPKLVQLMERKGIGRPSTYSPTIKTLKDRQYVQLSHGKLQPTPLGMELDAFLETVLPDLIQSEFTAQMEANLDVIASGKLDWEQYLTSWNRDYFSPSLYRAIAQIQAWKKSPNYSAKTETQTIDNPAAICDVRCPNCGAAMKKVFSKSQKLKADHFLSCDTRAGGCGTVMFLNVKTGTYELPYNQQQKTISAPAKTPLQTETIPPSKTRSTTQSKTTSKTRAKTPPKTEPTCPVCGVPLQRHEYTKEGQAKTMFRCSNPETRLSQCKEVAFFQTRRGNWWSPKFGDLPVQ